MNKEQVVLDALQQQRNPEMIEQLNQLKRENIGQYHQAIDGLYVQLSANQQQSKQQGGGQTRKKGNKKNYSLELANRKKKAKEEMKDEANRHRKFQMPLLTVESSLSSQKKINKAKEDAKKAVLDTGLDIKVQAGAKITKCREIVKHYPSYINELKMLGEDSSIEQITKLEAELKEAIIFIRKTSGFFAKTGKALSIVGKQVLTLGMKRPSEDEKLVRELVRGL